MTFKILRNILSLLTGHVIAKLLSLIGLIFLARQFGVEQFGIYATVMAYLTLFAAFADGGMHTVTIRAVAQDYARSDFYFSNVLILRVILSVVAYLMMLLLGSLWRKPEYSLPFIASCGLFLFPEALRKLAVSMLSAYERMDMIAALEVLATVLRYIPFFTAILLGKSLQTAFILLIISWTGVSALFLVLTRKRCLKHWMAPLNIRHWRTILYDAFPFGILFVLSMIFYKADTIMLSKMQGSTAVGFYEGAYKFIEAAMFIPLSIVNVLLPAMSRSYVTDKTSYQRMYTHSARILGMAILPVVIFVSFFSREIILFVYQEAYLPSASALSLLIWALFFIFLKAPVANIIATANLIHLFLPYAIANTLLNILLNFLLIPKYSFLGASLATVITEGTGLGIQLYFANRVLGNSSHILWIIGKILAAGTIASVIFYGVSAYTIFPLNVLILFSVYIVCLFALNVIGHEDKRLCREIINAAKAKLPFRI